jgi:serine/threonine protein kinase
MFMDGMISVILALHAKGIIHGDVKPANMLLCSDGKIGLCDFAEARLPGETAADWEGEATANYLSPRRCQNSGWPDHRDPAPEVEDDLYALGLSIWELYTGKVPFDDVYEDDIREMVSAGQTVNVEEIQDETAKAYIYEYLRPGGAKI